MNARGLDCINLDAERVAVGGAFSGLVYFLMGPVHGFNGFRTGNAVERAAKSAA